MNVNESFAESAKDVAKIESAYGANMTMMRDASCASFGTAFISVNRDGEPSAFRIFFGCRKLLCKRASNVGVSSIPISANPR